MAIPRVFVSSTCYDLKEIRDNLYEFIKSLGYHPVFSDKNEVFYHPDLHTHESCIKEIENCQLFVLIIGGRFGGKYIYDETKSIVNAEYDAARKLNLPVFTFVQKDVYSNQFTYSENIKNKLAEKINYPAIAKQEYAKNIFEFIISIRKTDENNGLFEFEFTRDIKNILRVQFAGLFYDFLWSRKREKESEKTKKLLYDLSSVSKKTEELIENIYRKVEQSNPEILINKLGLEDKARKFWYSILQIFHVSLILVSEERKNELSIVNKDDNWISFLTNKGQYYFIKEDGDRKSIFREGSTFFLLIEWPEEENEIHKKTSTRLKLLEENFEAYKQLSVEKRIEILESIQL